MLIKPNGDYSQISLAKFVEALQEPFLILDTETTGLQQGEIVQIAIIDQRRNVLLDTLVKPMGDIPRDAQQIHGITPEQVQNAPFWREIVPTVLEIISDKNIVVYNATYDRRMMYQSTSAAGMERIDWRNVSRWHCAMIAFAELYGDWNEYHRDYRWQRLSTAAAHMGAAVINAHNALGDCIMTAAVVERMLSGPQPQGVHTVEDIPW